MEHIDIDKNDVTPMDSIAPGVFGLRIVFVNVFGVVHADGSWTLIDAALPHSASRIRSWAQERFGKAPNAIVLTHGHFDHVSAAAELAEAWSIPVYAHAQEFPFLSGEREYTAPNWAAGGGAMSLLSPLYPRGPVDLRPHLRELSMNGPDGENDLLPGWTILHTPGHTPGHVSFHRSEDRTLLVGDAFCTTPAESFFEAALAQEPELHGPPAYFTSDWGEAKRSVQRLAKLAPLTVAPGHGKPLTGASVGPALQALAARFDAVAVPRNATE